ncbi:MAG: ABC transporter ATP-binding protein [Candidatus Eremiobacterota bacterium]
MKALQVEQLRKVYPNGLEALKGVDLDVADGDFFALLGPNGAGKSTLIGILTSLVRKTSGRVSVYGHDLDREMSRVKACLGVVPQEFNFNVFESVANTVVFQAGYYGIPRAEAERRARHHLEALELWGKRDEPVRNLSGGMKRRLMLARALVNQPRLLILDEPTAGLDIELRRSLWEYLAELNRAGTSIILTTHYLEEAENLCRNVAIIDHGQVLQRSTVRDLVAQLNVQTFLLDLAATREEAPHLEGFPASLTDPHTLEVEVSREQTLNEVFSQLARQGVEVRSMRPRANRLEELFLTMVGKAS